MRIPRSHALTHALIDRFGLATQPFTMDNPQAYCFFGGSARPPRRAGRRPDACSASRPRCTSALAPTQLWAPQLEPFARGSRTDGDDAWVRDRGRVRPVLRARVPRAARVVRGRDRDVRPRSFNQEALMNSSFLELLREELGRLLHRPRLPRRRHRPAARGRSCPSSRTRIRFGAKDGRDRADPTRASRCTAATRAGRFSETADYAVAHGAVPGAAPRRGADAVLAARSSARSASSTTTRRRRCSCSSGGGSGRRTTASSAAARVTDLAVRNVYYPDHGRQTGRGVVLASYTWGEDAQRWGSLVARRPDRAGARGRRPRIHPQAAERVRGGRVEDVARRRVRRRRVRAVRSRPADAAVRGDLSRPRAGSTSRASTRRSRTRGSRARSSRACAPRPRSTSRRSPASRASRSCVAISSRSA